MSVWDYTFENTENRFGDAVLRFFKIEECLLKKQDMPIDHTHGYYELHLLLKGEYVFSLQQQKVELKAGEMLIIPPRCRHESVHLPQGGKSAVLALSIEPALGENGFYSYFTDSLDAFSKKPIKVSAELEEKITAYLSAGISGEIADYCRKKTLACQITITLFALLNGFASNSVYRKNGEDGNFQLMLGTFVDNLDIGLNEMAARLGYSPRHLSRKIKQIYGMSLRSLRDERMLAAARKLMESEEQLTLTAIARRSGFKNAAALKRKLEENKEKC